MDVLTMGFPVSIAVSFLVLFATLPFIMTAMGRIIDGSFQTLGQLIGSVGALKR
jgi:flagellar biosynthesis protein FliR